MLHQIGVGALGPVFRTYEPTRDRLVAVKVFRLDVTPEQARALADELGRAADAGLFHPSIVEPVAAGLEGTVAYRAEEYVAAESLDVAMRHYAPATLDKALPFITQLASAIDFARAAGVGHGALHPRDIFVTPDEARATGFGVVDAMERLGLRAPVRRPYSPPERIAGQAWSTPADVFSLAAIAFELLTGRRPSGVGDDMGSLSGASLGDRVGEIRGVLSKAMSEQPAERFQTAQAFSAALAAAAGLVETPVSVAPRQAAAPVTTPQPEIVTAPPEPVEPASELPLTAGVPLTTADVELALKDTGASVNVDSLPARSEDDRALEDFAGEPNPVSAFDSPREAARKAIAARKRQPKKKVETALFEPPREEPTVPVIPAEAMAALPEAMPIPLTPDPSSEVEEPVETTVEAETSAPIAAEDEPQHEEAEDEFKPLYPAVVSTDEDIDLVAAADVPVHVTPLEAVELDHSGRDRSDRVVAVDEYRAREASTKSERAWPRVSERASQERPQFERSDRGQSPGLNSPLSSNLSLGGAADQEAALGADTGGRQRVMMLPLALVAGLCLIIGYGIGYFVRGQDAVSSPSGPSATPTTGTSKPEPAATPVDAPPPAPEGALGSKPASTNTPPPSVAKPAPAANAPKSSSVTTPKTGHVVVNSTPEKAAVTVNGKWSGRTPLTLSDLKFGKYVVRVVEPGYEVGQQQFTLSANSASRTVDVTLKRKPEARRSPAPVKPSAAAATKPSAASETATAKPAAAKTPATIYVDSRPQGARVFLDNKEMGVTPVTLTDQTPGSRVVRLELPDHSPRSETIVVKPGVTTRVTGSLERIR